MSVGKEEETETYQSPDWYSLALGRVSAGAEAARRGRMKRTIVERCILV